MARLNTQLMLAKARARFSGFQLRLPPAVGGRSGSLVTGGTGFVRRTGSGAPLACPPALFLAASKEPPDIEQQRIATEKVDRFLSRICDAIGQAHDAWLRRAVLVEVRINAVTATGGTLKGAGLGPDIRLFAPQGDAWERSRTDAIATAIGNGWENWQRTVRVSGMPWYPAFAAVPSPVAPPTPNVPVPLAALTQVPISISQLQLKSQMRANYRGDDEFPDELFDAIGFAFEQSYNLWKNFQMVTNVIGTGPVPTFAPPYVPVGPVVGGVGNQTPGAWV